MQAIPTHYYLLLLNRTLVPSVCSSVQLSLRWSLNFLLLFGKGYTFSWNPYLFTTVLNYGNIIYIVKIMWTVCIEGLACFRWCTILFGCTGWRRTDWHNSCADAPADFPCRAAGLLVETDWRILKGSLSCHSF